MLEVKERARKERVLRRVRRERLTYLERRALADLWQRVDELERHHRDGAIMEAGSALGGSALVLAAAKDTARPLYLYDTFGMIPPPSAEDADDVHERYRAIAAGESPGIGGDTYYGYQDNLLDSIRSAFDRFGLSADGHNVHFVKGLYEETLRVDQPVALAHLDCDWYQSVKTCLERITPWLVPGGTLVIDDYRAWSGARKAVDEYFAERRDDFKFVERARLHVIKASA